LLLPLVSIMHLLRPLQVERMANGASVAFFVTPVNALMYQLCRSKRDVQQWLIVCDNPLRTRADFTDDDNAHVELYGTEHWLEAAGALRELVRSDARSFVLVFDVDEWPAWVCHVTELREIMLNGRCTGCSVILRHQNKPPHGMSSLLRHQVDYWVLRPEQQQHSASDLRQMRVHRLIRDLFARRFAQSADALLITHTNYIYLRPAFVYISSARQ